MTYFCFSLVRSGHHAIINWLQSHLSPVRWRKQKGIQVVRFPETGYVQGARLVGANLSKQSHERLKRKTQEFSHVCVNLENQHLTLDFDTVKTPREEICSILILRDPFNNIASFVRLQARDFKHSPKFEIELWKEHAKEFLEMTNRLINKMCINFNLWFSSQEYRDSISKRIGGEPDVDILNHIALQGKGSSFNRLDFEGRAQEMDLLGRWKSLDKNTKRLFDDEIFDLAEKIFGRDFVDPIKDQIQQK